MTYSYCRVIVNLGTKVTNFSETSKFLQKNLFNRPIYYK